LWASERKLRRFNQARRPKKWQAQTTEQLKQMTAILHGIQRQVVDPELASQIGRLADHMSATARSSRASDFSMSDFKESDFRRCDFSGANFQGGHFRGANLCGADLSMASIDANTKLPAM
jgi:uncharacterized protein YjbI with pentapeptide repeats